MTFEEKVRSMTAKEIILAMVESLEHPIINVDMDVWGEARPKRALGLIPFGKPVCFGCAATNTLCKIANVKFTTENIEDGRADAVNGNEQFVDRFESAIDCLRQGHISSYNCFASAHGFSLIKDVGIKLPCLKNSYTKKQLNVYRQLAEQQ